MRAAYEINGPWHAIAETNKVAAGNDTKALCGVAVKATELPWNHATDECSTCRSIVEAVQVSGYRCRVGTAYIASTSDERAVLTMDPAQAKVFNGPQAAFTALEWYVAYANPDAEVALEPLLDLTADELLAEHGIVGVPRGTRTCGIHGMDSSSGRCGGCDSYIESTVAFMVARLLSHGITEMEQAAALSVGERDHVLAVAAWSTLEEVAWYRAILAIGHA